MGVVLSKYQTYPDCKSDYKLYACRCNSQTRWNQQHTVLRTLTHHPSITANKRPATEQRTLLQISKTRRPAYQLVSTLSCSDSLRSIFTGRFRNEDVSSASPHMASQKRQWRASCWVMFCKDPQRKREGHVTGADKVFTPTYRQAIG
jgi:hypothetical protein